MAQCLAAAESSGHFAIEGESGDRARSWMAARHPRGEFAARHSRPLAHRLDCGGDARIAGGARSCSAGSVGRRARARRWKARGVADPRAAGALSSWDELSALPAAGRDRGCLRVLREGADLPLGGSAPVAVTARVVAAPARAPLGSEARAGRLRQDLAAAPGRDARVTVPPLLRSGGRTSWCWSGRFAEETASGARHGLRGASPRPSAAALLAAHAWPGNVRELHAT